MKYTLFVLFVFSVLQLYSQVIVSGSPNQILQYQMAKSAKDIAYSAINLKRNKADLENSLVNARKKFWTQYQQGKIQPEMKVEYLELLDAKDMYMMLLEMQDMLYKAMGGQSGKTLSGPRQAIEYISGGKLDGGIDKFAYLEWNQWRQNCRLIFEAELIKTRAADIHASMEKALSGSFGFYTQYLEKRNLSEYLFSNPFSGLQSSSPGEYFEAWILATGSAQDMATAQKIVSETSQVTSKENFGQMVVRLKATEIFSLENLQAHRAPNYSLAIADWYLSEKDPSLMPYYLIKRKNGVSWAVSKKIYQKRVIRHGQAKIDAVMKEINLKLNDPTSGCIGNPLILFEKQKNARKFLAFNDCMADKLNGQAELWQDAYEIAIADMDKAVLKKKFLEQVALALEKAPGAGISAESSYQELTSYLSEDLLLAAIYNQQNYGDGQIIADWPDSQNNTEYLSYSKLYFALRILEGFATQQKNYRTFGILLLWDIHPFGKLDADIVFSLINALKEFKSLELKHGSEKTNEAVKKLMPKVLAAYYPRRNVNRNYLIAALEAPAIPIEKTQQDDLEKQALRAKLATKYKTTFSKYAKNYNSQGRIFENSEMAMYLRGCTNPKNNGDNNAQVDIYFKTQEAFIKSNTDEHVVRAQELFVPVIRLHCPFMTAASISYYIQGSHKLAIGRILNDADFEAYLETKRRMNNRRGTEGTQQLTPESQEKPFGNSKITLEQGKIRVCYGNSDCQF